MILRVELPWACFGLVIRENRVIRAAPIAWYCTGWPTAKALAYWRGRGARIEVLP